MNMTELYTKSDELINTHFGDISLQGRTNPALYVFDDTGVSQVKMRTGEQNSTPEDTEYEKKQGAQAMKIISQNPKVKAMLLVMDTVVKDEEGQSEDMLLSMLYSREESHVRSISHGDAGITDFGWEETACGGRFGNPWISNSE